MPRFFYRAKNLEGKEESGTLEARDRQELMRILKKKGYFLVSLEGGTETAKTKKEFKLEGLKFLAQLLAVPLKEKLIFTRNLTVMIKTAVPLPRAFDILANQTKNSKFKKALKAISERIVKGDSLSGALSAFPKIFPELYVETIKVGEETGKLEDSLAALSFRMEREHSLKAKMKTAMVYPVMVLGIAFLIGVLMFIFAVPKLKEAFEELDVALPFTTEIIFGFADFLVKKWPLAILILLGLTVVAVIAARTKKGGKVKSFVFLKIPFVSGLIKRINTATVLRTLSSLLKSGVPVVRSLEVTSGALGNFYFKQSLKEAARRVEKGGRIFQVLAPHEDLYSSLVLQMLEVGEETGETSEILEKLADFYEEEIGNAVQKLSAVIEPVLILMIGAVVGFFAISMMQPMFSVMQGIK